MFDLEAENVVSTLLVTGPALPHVYVTTSSGINLPPRIATTVDLAAADTRATQSSCAVQFTKCSRLHSMLQWVEVLPCVGAGIASATHAC